MRSTTLWDVASERVSVLFAQNDPPGPARLPSTHATYGTRPLPGDLGSACDVGDAAAPLPPPRPAPSRAHHGDLQPVTLALQEDMLSLVADPTGVSPATAQLRQQHRVVGGSLERASPYWAPPRAPPGEAAAPAAAALRDATRVDPAVVRASRAGPERARIPLVGREYERYAAAYTRNVLMARANKPLDELVSSDDDAEDSDAHTPAAQRRRLVNAVNEVLPRSAQWTQEHERALLADEFGWLHAPARGTSAWLTQTPASRTAYVCALLTQTLLDALHYYVSRFYAAHGQIAPPILHTAPSDLSAERAQRLRDALARPTPTMQRGDELFAFWARLSLGCARTMALRFDASALVALGTLVRALVHEHGRGAGPPDDQRQGSSARPPRRSARRARRARRARARAVSELWAAVAARRAPGPQRTSSRQWWHATGYR